MYSSMDIVKAINFIYLVISWMCHEDTCAIRLSQLIGKHSKSNLHLLNTNRTLQHSPIEIHNDMPYNATIQKLIERSDTLENFKKKMKKIRRYMSIKRRNKTWRQWRKELKKKLRQQNRNQIKDKRRKKMPKEIRNENKSPSPIDEFRTKSGRILKTGVIIGGENVVDLSVVPYQAGIWLKRKGQMAHHCGGTILNNHIILTAAHCFMNSLDTRDYIITVGDLDITHVDEYEQSFQVWQIFNHPLFNANKLGGYVYDIALVLVRPTSRGFIQFSSDVRPVYLPNNELQIFPMENCFASGWGRTTTDLSGPFSDSLKIARTDILDMDGQKKCNGSYMGEITKTMLCAGYLDGTPIDSCVGDSGGPLVCDIEGKDVVLGIISWGTTSCAARGFPGVYTNVQELLPWLDSFK